MGWADGWLGRIVAVAAPAQRPAPGRRGGPREPFRVSPVSPFVRCPRTQCLLYCFSPDDRGGPLLATLEVSQKVKIAKTNLINGTSDGMSSFSLISIIFFFKKTLSLQAS